ncbi:hypothetical protein C8A03DRAFT_47980 [Achaetomium macrosporum]|uniref:Uncharacterized protein n=1 Tax=Achaetomium macrosporum TaxID=79813 RepID=A0AAN7C1H6_9PEZI|nr:hypothetical protein C8A03DRAFT_47980 [Achaetomium macrosporum]
MSRLSLYRPFRAVLGSAKFTSRVPSGQTIRVERVKIKRANPTRRFLGTVFKVALVTQAFLVALPALFPEVEDDDEHEDDPLFIPFPFTTKKIPGRPYRGSDPEWREFVRLSKDPQSLRRVRDYVANLAFQAASSSPILAMKIGKPTRIRRYWLDIEYPVMAPPTYERSGLLVTEEELQWATVPCDPWTATIMSRVLWPQPVALGLWALGKAAAKQTALDIARYFGFATENPAGGQARPNPGTLQPLPPMQSPEVQKVLERLRQQTTRRPAEVDDPSSVSSSAATPPTAPRDKAHGAPDKPALDQSNQATPDQNSWVKEVTSSIAKAQPWETFKKTWRREFLNELKVDPVPGAFFVWGLVEIETPKACLVIDMYTWYDPKTKSYQPGTLKMRLRRVQPKMQSPVVPR